MSTVFSNEEYADIHLMYEFYNRNGQAYEATVRDFPEEQLKATDLFEHSNIRLADTSNIDEKAESDSSAVVSITGIAEEEKEENDNDEDGDGGDGDDERRRWRREFAVVICSDI
uniref:Uncharacterized protein n=1 Tax=Vespula pensylvanica TaxID=30213 RepID=A0A834KJY5_VESPE|nr:hypothetical protein H0235_014211 [Vespula pensylvanica]